MSPGEALPVFILKCSDHEIGDGSYVRFEGSNIVRENVVGSLVLIHLDDLDLIAAASIRIFDVHAALAAVLAFGNI